MAGGGALLVLIFEESWTLLLIVERVQHFKLLGITISHHMNIIGKHTLTR